MRNSKLSAVFKPRVDMKLSLWPHARLQRRFNVSLGCVLLLLLLTSCFGEADSEEIEHPSSYKEVGQVDLVKLTYEGSHSTFSSWRLRGALEGYYYFAEVFQLFPLERMNIAAFFSPRKIKVRKLEIEFSGGYLKNIGGDVFLLGSREERFCAHDLKKPSQKRISEWVAVDDHP